MIGRPLEMLLLRSKLVTDVDAARMLSRGAAWAAYGLGGLSLLGTLGVDTSPLLAGVGITGVTIGFAVKEVATNFLSGAMLVMGRHVRKGQHIRLLCAPYPNVEGVVESLDWRNVVLVRPPSLNVAAANATPSSATMPAYSNALLNAPPSHPPAPLSSASIPYSISSSPQVTRIVVPSVIVFTNPFIIMNGESGNAGSAK